MSVIDRFMLSYALRQVDRVAVDASPAAAYAAIRGVDFYRTRIARGLFWLRAVPDRLLARIRGNPVPFPGSARIEDITGETGFHVLAEQPDTEIVVGSIGRFWQPAIEFVGVHPDAFAAFEQPGFGKLAWSLRVDPREHGGSWITFDLRVGATDAASLARFELYWRVIGQFSHFLRRSLLRLFEADLGVPLADASRTLAGDEILPFARLSKTHAITIEAPVEKVWPWLVQMGCRRGGWYSYDRLDNGGVESASRIIPELQDVHVGDLLPATPSDESGFAVLRMEPSRSLVLGSPCLIPGGASPPTGMFGASYRTTWSFVLEPIGEAATRLVVRVRGDYESGARAAITTAALLPLHEVMERKQLRTIKRHAEAAMATP